MCKHMHTHSAHLSEQCLTLCCQHCVNITNKQHGQAFSLG